MPNATAKTSQFPMLNIRGGFVPNTVNEEQHTVEVTWTTGERGLRNGDFGSYYEELAIEPENVQTNRIIGAPVLDQHQHTSIRNTLGVVDSVRPIKGTNGKVIEWRAVVRFCDEALDVFAKVAKGFIRFVSVGYFVNRCLELEESFNQLPILRAVDWTPAEISFVTVPFDSKASVRSSELTSECTIIPFSRSQNMPEQTAAATEPETVLTEPEKAAPEPAPTAPATAERRAAPITAPAGTVNYEHITLIRQAAKVAGMNAEDTEGYERMLASNKTVDDVRAAIIADAFKRQKPIDTASARVTAGADLNREGVERGISEVLLARALPSSYGSKVTESGKRFMRDSVLRMAERLLEANGVSLDGMSTQRVISEACKFRSGSHSTSDFYHLFESSVDRILKDEFNKVRLTYLPLARNVELPDFRKSNYVIVGDNFNLRRQDENEEVTYGTFDADGRSFGLATFARGIKWSRQMMINDDLSVLSRLPSMVGRAGDKLKARMAWSMIVGDGDRIGPNGVTMSDGNPLFAPVHGNLAATGGAINKASVAEARKAIRKQRAFGGEDEIDTLDLEPRYLICGPEREQEAIEFLAANFVAVNQENAAALNLTRSLTLIVENRIIDTSWYLASPDIDGIITATLQGEQGMFLETDSDFETDGFKMKGRLDFGVHMARWEGWYKNPGV